MTAPSQRVPFALAWIAVCFTRVVLLVNGIIYAKAGVSYLSSSFDAFPLREAGDSSLYRFPELSPVLRDSVIQSQFDGLIILAPFMGAAYACVGFTSLAAAFTFRNYEAAMTLLLQAALLSMMGCIARPYEPEDLYNEGQQDKVQSSQMVAVVTGWIGAFGPIVAALLKQSVPTPVEYAMALLSCDANEGNAKATDADVVEMIDGGAGG